jgi:hypothetical protein
MYAAIRKILLRDGQTTTKQISQDIHACLVEGQIVNIIETAIANEVSRHQGTLHVRTLKISQELSSTIINYKLPSMCSKIHLFDFSDAARITANITTLLQQKMLRGS